MASPSPADTSFLPSLRRAISIFPGDTTSQLLAQIKLGWASWQGGRSARSPYSREGLVAWGPGSWSLIHQLGGFHSDNGFDLWGQDGRGRFMAPLPPGLSRARWLQRTLSPQEVACIWPRSLLAWRPVVSVMKQRGRGRGGGDRNPGLGEKTGTSFLRAASWGAHLSVGPGSPSHTRITEGRSSDEKTGPETDRAVLRLPGRAGHPRSPRNAAAQGLLSSGSFPVGEAGGPQTRTHAGTRAAFQLLLFGKKVWGRCQPMWGEGSCASRRPWACPQCFRVSPPAPPAPLPPSAHAHGGSPQSRAGKARTEADVPSQPPAPCPQPPGPWPLLA